MLAKNSTKCTEVRKFFTLKYLLAVTGAAILIAAAAVFLVNDAFAISKTNEPVTVHIPENSSKSDIAKILKKEGLIKSRAWFSVYTAMRKKDVKNTKQVYTLQKNSGFDGICLALKSGGGQSLTEVKVTIPEGSSVDAIMQIICDEHGICSREEFVNTLQNGDFSKYTFTKQLDKTKSERKYRLEGYLYPDTYCFYSSSSAYAVIDKMLSNFAAKIDSKYLAACKNQGMTLDEAVTLGSLIIREGKYPSDFPKISSVFHNRLKSPAFSYRLQSDATTVYALGREMLPEDKELDSPYNTYKNGGLPPSPICSPDLTAISYAIYPDKTSYCYFVTKKDGSVLYARDYQTHLANIRLSEE